MTIEETTKTIKRCAREMNSRYKKVVFDEWAVVSFSKRNSRVLDYAGPRNDGFLKSFPDDLGTLRHELAAARHGVGDFEFTRNGVGTLFEAFMVLGKGIYLICNNTMNSMDDITKDSRWLEAQVPFVELSDWVRSNPVTQAA